MRVRCFIGTYAHQRTALAAISNYGPANITANILQVTRELLAKCERAPLTPAGMTVSGASSINLTTTMGYVTPKCGFTPPMRRSVPGAMIEMSGATLMRTPETVIVHRTHVLLACWLDRDIEPMTAPLNPLSVSSALVPLGAVAGLAGRIGKLSPKLGRLVRLPERIVGCHQIFARIHQPAHARISLLGQDLVPGER